MDLTDLKIFSRLVADPFRSDESLSREVGLTGKAVRLRRKRMEAEGILKEYAVHPRAEILGRHALAWGYIAEDRLDLPISKLSEIEDLVYVRTFRPNLYMVVRFTEDAREEDDPRLARILGPPFGGPLDERPPRSSIGPDALSRVDWKVLEAVVRMPREPYLMQARNAGVSPRTFRLHRSKLERSQVLECAAILNLEREAGLATYGIWLKVNGSFDEKALELSHLWDRPHRTRNPPGVFLLGSCDSYFEARELELRLRSLPGVIGADPLIPAGGFFARERVLGWIRAEREKRFQARRQT